MSEMLLDAWLPAGAAVRIKGVLLTEYGADDLALLDQDMLEIELPGDLRIDVGWFPENDPAGRFLIRVFRKGELTPIQDPIEAKTPAEVASQIGALVRQYCPRPSQLA